MGRTAQSCIHAANSVISGRGSNAFLRQRMWTHARVNSTLVRVKLAVYGMRANWGPGLPPPGAARSPRPGPRAAPGLS